MEDILRKLVSFRTVTGEQQAAHELIEYVAEFVTKRGMHVERFVSNGYESLVATTKPGDKHPSVMLGAHADVVAAPDELFELRRDGDKLFGRGTLDMKFALAGYLQIIDDLRDRLHEYSLGLMVTTDEEIGGRDGTLQLLAEGYRANVFIIPDGGENWQVQTASKGIHIFKITASGTSVHSSRHWQGDNAIKKLLPAIAELEALVPAEQGPETNTISVNKISAGRNMTQVPNKATMTIDLRTLNADDHTRLHDAVMAICQSHGLECELEADGDPTYFDLANPFIASFVSLIEDTTGITVTGAHTLGSNDARFIAPLDIPCISFYPTGAGLHSAEEWISVQAFQDFYSITGRYIEQIAHVTPPAVNSVNSLKRANFARFARDLQRRVVRNR